MFVPQSSCLGNEFGSSYAGFSRPGSRSARRSGQGVCRERPRPQQLRHGRVGPGRKRRPNGTTSIGRESLPGRGRGKRGQRTRSHGGQSATSPGGMLLRLCAFPDARRVAVDNTVRVAKACLHLPPRILAHHPKCRRLLRNIVYFPPGYPRSILRHIHSNYLFQQG